MVVREDPDSAAALCIPQSQHAAISGQIAAAWGNDMFEPPTPRAEVIEAATRHDDGMDDFDAEPELDPDTGLPRNFMRMPFGAWLDCWHRGPAIVGDDDPYAGILVSMHGSYLLDYRNLTDPAEADLAAAWLSEQEELRDEWAGEVERLPDVAPGLGRERLEHNRALIALWDAFSLAVCMPRLPDQIEGVGDGGSDVRFVLDEIESGPGLQGPRVVSIGPWPFEREAVDLGARGRVLERRYEDRAVDAGRARRGRADGDRDDPGPGFGLAGRLAGQRLGSRAIEQLAVDAEAGAVAGAVPGHVGGVEVDLAAEVGAEGGDRMQAALGVAVAGDLAGGAGDDRALARLEVVDRPAAAVEQAVADEVQPDLEVLGDELRPLCAQREP